MRTTTVPTPNCCCAIWPITMFELSPSVATTTASASSMPASRRSGRSIPWPTMNSPSQSSPRRPSASSRSSTTDTSQPASRKSFATAEPTRPQPTTITFTRARVAQCPRVALGSGELLVEHALREDDNKDLARRVPQNEVDSRREETRLATPARRRSEHDQVGIGLAGAVDDGAADRARADRRHVHLDAVLAPERDGFLERGLRARLVLRHRAV